MVQTHGPYSVGGIFFFDRSGHYRGPQRSVRTEIRLYRMCLGCFCLLFCDDVSLLAGGAKIYPIHYDLKSIGKYLLLALVLYGIAVSVPIENMLLLWGSGPSCYLSI